MKSSNKKAAIRQLNQIWPMPVFVMIQRDDRTECLIFQLVQTRPWLGALLQFCALSRSFLQVQKLEVLIA